MIKLRAKCAADLPSWVESVELTFPRVSSRVYVSFKHNNQRTATRDPLIISTCNSSDKARKKIQKRHLQAISVPSVELERIVATVGSVVRHRCLSPRLAAKKSSSVLWGERRVEIAAPELLDKEAYTLVLFYSEEWGVTACLIASEEEEPGAPAVLSAAARPAEVELCEMSHQSQSIGSPPRA